MPSHSKTVRGGVSHCTESIREVDLLIIGAVDGHLVLFASGVRDRELGPETIDVVEILNWMENNTGLS